MFWINQLKLDIQAYSNSNPKERFGFNHKFTKGLNVIKGENSSGKSTIVSCIYFALGLEELLGGKNLKALDKSLHKSFTSNGTFFNVLTSSVYIEIENNKGEIHTLHRIIKGDKENTPEQFIKIKYGKLDESNNDNCIITYVHRVNDNHNNYGFYKWFTNFIGISLPEVSTYENENKILYLQTIFPALFIEQTKGWSDFLATQPYFQIKDNKLRAIEFILDLKSLFTEVEKNRLEEDKKKIAKEWVHITNKIDLLKMEALIKIDNLPKEPTIEAEKLKEISIKFKKSINDIDYFSVKDYLIDINNQNKNIDDTPISVTKNENPILREMLYKKMQDLEKYKKNESELLNQIAEQESQLRLYKIHLNNLNNEISANRDIKYLTEKHSEINQLDKCPTCNQNIDKELIKHHITIEVNTIDANIKYLENQKKLLTTSIKSLESTINEKNILKQHYKTTISNVENEIKYINKELYDVEKMPSRSQLYKKMLLEAEVKKVQNINITFEELVGELYNLSERFSNNAIESESLKGNQDIDFKLLGEFEEKFRIVLKYFEYNSNRMDTIFVQKVQPFKYFPVVTISGEIQKIQISSSASDFIRSIWAYTITLLLMGKNHPGLLLIDEPSQHAMKQSSLTKFFKSLKSPNLAKNQVIIAASTEKRENEDDNSMPYTLDVVLQGIEHNAIKIGKKSIEKIES